MLMTARANLSVGPPYDLAIYRNGSLELDEVRIEADSPFLDQLDAVWTRHLFEAIADLPRAPPHVAPRLRRYAARTSNSVSVSGPKLVISATSTASRPRPTTTRPTRRRLLRASKVCQRPSR